MNQEKIGGFLKELRKEKGYTQEQIAEKFAVSNRTVSRWENGNNMPDLDILIEISDFYEVDLREILNGERKKENMDNEIKETVLKAADYNNMEAEKYNKRVRLCYGLAALAILISLLFPEDSDNSVLMLVNDILRGFSVGMMFVGLVFSSRYGAKIRAFKRRVFAKTSKQS